MSLKRAILAGVSTALISTTAMAGGFDRGGVQIDQLFDAGTTIGARLSYVMPQRELTNYQRLNNAAGAPPASAAKVDVEGNYTNYSFGVKTQIATGFDCLAHYSQPYGADADYGTGNAQSLSAVEFSIATDDYGLTCSYQFAAGNFSVGQGFGRIIVGGSYQEIEGFQSRQSFLDFSNAGVGAIGGITNTAGIGTFSVTDEAFGWRAGAAYEIPAIALRAMVLYSSKYDFDGVSGIQNNTGFGALIPGTGLVPITLQTEIPQALDIKLQSGIREGTLAFANFRWQDWSQLQSITINGGRNPATGGPSNLAFEPFYRDGYTISAGIGQVITEEISALAAIGWDRGTSTTSGTQTDTWTLSGGIQYKPYDNIEFNFGGLIGVLTDGNSVPNPAQQDQSNSVTYSFDNDMVYALSASFKAKF